MPWIKRQLRGNAVFVRARASGEPAADAKGLVEIVYKLEPGAKLYRASVRNLQPTGDPADDQPFTSDVQVGGDGKSGSTAAASQPVPKDAIVIYTDGACTGNPGPAGIGVVILDGTARRELSEYLGEGTNNIAELTAILRALEEIEPDAPATIHTDSQYAIGVLQKGWKAKANKELIADLRRAMETRPVRLVYVRGHAGVPLNERADELARRAISERGDGRMTAVASRS